MKKASGRLATVRFVSQSTGTEVEYKTLVPLHPPNDNPLPLVLHLHGAMSSAASLEAARSAYERAWASGDLPPAIVACASTPTLGGFYIDYPDGPHWESLVGTELRQHLDTSYRIGRPWAAIGFSMGGYGVLKIALRNPEHCVAVAALCPVVFPAESADAVPTVNRPSLLSDLNQAMGTDAETYSSNCVYHILRRNLTALRFASPEIYLDCGEIDEFRLHDGAMYLHKLLRQLSVPHTFRSVPGAGHADARAPERQEAAIRFIGHALRHD